MHNKPSFLESEHLASNHILPASAIAAGLRYSRSEKFAEVECEDGLRIRSSPHRLLISSPPSHSCEDADALLRLVLDRYVAAAPEMVCKALEIKPVAELADSVNISVPLFMHAAAMQTYRLSPALKKFHVELNGARLSFVEKKLALSLDRDSNSIEDVVGMIFSADFNHELHSPQVECSEIGSFAARNSRRDVEQFRQHIGRLIEQERIERCRKYSLGDFGDLAEYAQTLGFPNPNRATKFKARKLVLALFARHPSYYMVEPAEDGAISISASSEQRHCVTLLVKPDGTASCHVFRKGQESGASYNSIAGLPDEFILDALSAQA